jgi:hypothetical protein
MEYWKEVAEEDALGNLFKEEVCAWLSFNGTYEELPKEYHDYVNARKDVLGRPWHELHPDECKPFKVVNNGWDIADGRYIFEGLTPEQLKTLDDAWMNLAIWKTLSTKDYVDLLYNTVPVSVEKDILDRDTDENPEDINDVMHYLRK